jgi:lipoprotein-anchoring transpeptidase ErfK/SrfK
MTLLLALSPAGAPVMAAPPAAPAAAPSASPRPAAPAPTVALKPGEYLWMPELAPEGPVVIVISLPEQLAYVYRNGVRIGVSTVSTGKAGYETPTGVFTILQKQREHFSNLYDNAPMPFMQRLTWDGVAMHAGRIPGYPASHGCVRLPYAFSEKLFGATTRGMTVVIASERSHAPEVSAPGWFAPVDPATGAPKTPGPVIDDAETWWLPERAPDGPLTVVLSTLDRRVSVLRNGVEIGRARVEIGDEPLRGTHAYVLLEGMGEGFSDIVRDRPALRWLAIAVPTHASRAPSEGDLHEALASGQIRVDDVFAHRIYDALRPGATVIVTDEPLRRAAPEGMTVIRADEENATPVTPAPVPAPQTAPPKD